MPARTVAQDGEVRGPELPAGMDWPEQTLRWWETWRSSPQSQTFTQSDWDFLIDTALLHASLWSGKLAAATEVRLRVAKFGATPEDRLRLRLQVGEPAAATGEPGQPAQPATGRYAHLRSLPTG